MTFQKDCKVLGPFFEEAAGMALPVAATCRSTSARNSSRVDFARYRLEQDRLAVDLVRELAVGVVDERDAIGHAGAEVGAGRAEHHDRAAGHVLAAMVADAFDNSGSAAVADAEALAGSTGREQDPPVAPYRIVLPAITCGVSKGAARGGRMAISPPAMPLPT